MKTSPAFADPAANGALARQHVWRRHLALMVTAAVAITSALVAAVADSASASIPVGVPQLAFDGAPTDPRNYVVTRADDERVVIEESGWGFDEEWTPTAELLEPGQAYAATILVSLEQLPPTYRLPTVSSEPFGPDALIGKDPVVTEWDVHYGPELFEVPSAQLGALNSGSLNGLRMHLFPSFSPTGTNDDFDDRGFSPDPEAFVMQDPWYEIASTESVSGYSYMHMARLPDMNRRAFNGFGQEHEWADIFISTIINSFEALGWLISYPVDEIVSGACWVAHGWQKVFRPSKASKTRHDCMKGTGKTRDIEMTVTADVGYTDTGDHSLMNTSGAVPSSIETFVGSQQMGETAEGVPGLELDLSESNVGLFPFTTGYSAKGLGYLEIDPADVVVDADGKVELTFGVKGPAGAQAWLDGVDRTDTLPGYRVQLGPDDGLAVAYSGETTVGSWNFNMDDFDHHKPEEAEALFMAAQEDMADDINAKLGDLVVEVLQDQPPSEVQVGEPIRLEPGVRYPLTLLGWAGHSAGTLGLYMLDDDQAATPVPMRWITPAAEGTRGFNDPVYPDNEWEPASDSYSMMMSADGSRLAELTEDGLTTSSAHWDGTWLPAEPFTFDRPLTTMTVDDIAGENETALLSLDNRVAMNGDGTVVAAALDQGMAPDEVLVVDAEQSTVRVQFPYDPGQDRPAVMVPVDDVDVAWFVDENGAPLPTSFTAESVHEDHGFTMIQTVDVTDLEFEVKADNTIGHIRVAGTARSHDVGNNSTRTSDIGFVSGHVDGELIHLDLYGSEGGTLHAQLVIGPDVHHESRWTSGEVMIAESSSPWLPLDDTNASVTYLSRVLEQAGAESFRGQDGTLFARTLAIDADGENLAVSEVWVEDPAASSVDSTASSRLMVFNKVGNQWRLSADTERNSATALDGELRAVVQDGGHAWIAAGTPSVIHQIDVATMQTVATVDTGINVTAAAVNADHLIALGADGTVMLIGVDTMQIESTTRYEELVNPTQAIALNDDLFVANGGDVSRPAHVGVHLDLAQQAVVSTYGELGVHTIFSHAEGGGPTTSTVTQSSDRHVWFTTPASTTIVRVDLDDLNTTEFDMSGEGVWGVAGVSFTRSQAWLFPHNPVGSIKLHDPGAAQEIWETRIAFEFDPFSGAYVYDEGGADVSSRDVVLYDTPISHPAQRTADIGSDAVFSLEWSDGTPTVVISFDDVNTHVYDHQLDMEGYESGGPTGVGETALRYPVAPQLPDREWVSAEMWVVQGYVLVAVSDGDDTYVVSLTPTAYGFNDGETPEHLGANVDVFGGSIDIARDGDGVVRLVTTTPYGVAVYRNDNGTLHGEAATYTSSRRYITHTNAVAFSDDGRTLFTSDPNYTAADEREVAGALRIYQLGQDGWDLSAEFGAPFDSTSSAGQAFGGKVVANGRFLMVGGVTDPIEYDPQWMFRDVWGGWSEFRVRNYIAPPEGAPPAPGSGSFAPTVGGYQWFMPTALIGHRPYDIKHSSGLYNQTASLPFDVLREYRQFPIADLGD